MDWVIDLLAPPIDGADVPQAAFDPMEATDISIDVDIDSNVEEDSWLSRLLDESELRRLHGDKREALDLLGIALRIDDRNDILRARYFALASELTIRPGRGDETLQIATHY